MRGLFVLGHKVTLNMLTGSISSKMYTSHSRNSGFAESKIYSAIGFDGQSFTQICQKKVQEVIKR